MAAMSGHGKLECIRCGTVYKQCRCIHGHEQPNRRHGLCRDCAGMAAYGKTLERVGTFQGPTTMT